MARTRLVLILSGLLLLPFWGFGQRADTVALYNGVEPLLRIDHGVSVCVVSTSTYNRDEVAGFSFKEAVRGIPNLVIRNSTGRVKLSLLNTTDDSLLDLSVRQPSIDQICLYRG